MAFQYSEYLKDFTSEDDVKAKSRNMICNYFNCKKSLFVSTGTIALEVALRALNLPKGTGVAVPEISYIATATAVVNCGLIPVYIDIDEKHYGMSIQSLKNHTEEIGVVIVVHFAGFVNRDVYKIKEHCSKRGIFLIEDCAQAFPNMINNQHVGTIGDIGTFSLQTFKLINCGEGGLIISDNEKIMKRCEAISNWGISYEPLDRTYKIASSNYRMSAIQCYFIIKQLEKINEICKERIDELRELESICLKHKISTSCPQNSENIIEYPFYLPIMSNKKLNYLPPQNEYPMRNSIIISSIFKQFYPELMRKYETINKNSHLNIISNKVIAEIEFISFKVKRTVPWENFLLQYV
jgi:dTDP-4-amino-4,6-dideoxygalactose transaminase